MQSSANQIVRRPKSTLAVYSTNIVHLRNPFVVAWWSLAYPGFGHFRLISTFKGMFLFVGELLINTHAHINQAIIYSLTGKITMAKQVLDTHLLLLYCGILIFAVWDSYRATIEINKLSVLADHENAVISPTMLSPAGINFLEKRNPWVAAAWAAMMPGMGHLYTVSVLHAMFLLIIGTIIVYFSHLLPAIGYVAIGDLAQAKTVLDPQWVLNFPSFYCFSIYDAYVKTVEINKAFDQEQAQYFRNNYQSPLFQMPL
ncbi:MAG: hypothetical protein PHC92_07600 [Syntrophomonadaceae bacterium]|nr:hypothetical protein [Syntrophomonadaceae bacterium]